LSDIEKQGDKDKVKKEKKGAEKRKLKKIKKITCYLIPPLSRLKTLAANTPIISRDCRQLFHLWHPSRQNPPTQKLFTNNMLL
jgi:hypothetical protein